MSLRLRLMLGIVLLVGFTMGLAVLVQHQVMRPFADQVFRGFAAQAVFIAERVESGADPEQLGENMGLEVLFVPGPPDDPDIKRKIELAGPPERRGKRGRRRWSDHPSTEHPHDRQTTRGRTLVFPRGPRDRVYVETRKGWLLVARDLDLQAPERAGLGLLVLVGLLVLGLASVLAAIGTRPLSHTARAMDRIARGDLDHRLDESAGAPELQQLARAFNRMVDRVDHMLRSEKQLMASVSHDLRTPLTRMRLELELLRDLGPSEARLDAITSDINELDTLIGELLALSRLQLGDQALSLEPTRLEELAASAIEAARLTDHAVSIEGSAELSVDPRLLSRALANLLQNLERYTPAGTSAVLTVHPDGLSLTDEGPGVPKEALEHLFDPFFRVESSRSRATGGTGLGLMIVAEVARAHGGRAEASVGDKGGLCVRMWLR